MKKHTVQCTGLNDCEVYINKQTVQCTGLNTMYSVHDQTNCTPYSTGLVILYNVHKEKLCTVQV